MLKNQEECLSFWSTMAAERREKAEAKDSSHGPHDAIESWAELASQA